MSRTTRVRNLAGTLVLGGMALAAAAWPPAPASVDSSRAQRIDPGSQ